jgi:lipoate-protein ligase A
MALDEVLAEQVGAGERAPTLRVWEWASNAVIIGSFQSLANEVDLLGIAATYQPINDITSPAGKIAGAAQKRFTGGAVLHHVTMAYDMDAAKMLEVLRIGPGARHRQVRHRGVAGPSALTPTREKILRLSGRLGW